MKPLDFSKPRIMGILNVTPDSFSDGGHFPSTQAAVARAHEMVAQGADVLDLGGESTRPGSDPVSVQEELRRLQPVLEQLVDKISIPLSIDTYKPEVARACLEMGANLLNDVTGLRNPAILELAADYQVPVVCMHMLGNPKNMQEKPVYVDVVMDLLAYFRDRLAAAKEAGLRQVILDPGIGFGKTTAHNLQLLKRLAEFKELGKPLCVGPSRKSFIGNVLGLDVNNRLEGTLAAVAVSVWNGADLVRVHDVRDARRVIDLVQAIKEA
ncbi:MAG TPA: dihydropteroate synthase [Candidatus Diapherotrites archaeon]|uniref:dihydropteroate synthase n=1 Tax=Candidatus Iainarchaeum sp. TaxID=3101447 RepID=A0A7J4JJI0_9ARCH|nr:dihydropteroate synthase [Candidatus Diapherotrites archaeon]HIH16769.1 dihydropteroate synthase [Candidatus Diapherotrites archaeon]